MTPSHHADQREITSKQAGEAEIQSHHKPHPRHANLQLEGNSKLEFLLQEQRVHIPHQASQFLRPAPEKQAPKHLALKTNRAHTHKTTELR